MTSLKTIACAAAAALLLSTGSASAQGAENIANTNWTLQINGEIVNLVITSQGGPGAPGAATCRHINGDIGNVAQIRGWYCPSTRRIHFVHRNEGSGDAVRVFTGNLSDDVAGQPLYMAGTVTVLISAFGNLGEYNFSGVTY